MNAGFASAWLAGLAVQSGAVRSKGEYEGEKGGDLCDSSARRSSKKEWRCTAAGKLFKGGVGCIEGEARLQSSDEKRLEGEVKGGEHSGGTGERGGMGGGTSELLSTLGENSSL